MQGITGLAIPRHTGLGYLVISNFRNASPKMHFIYLTFSGEKYFRKLLEITVLLYNKAAEGNFVICIVMSTPQVVVPRKLQ